MGSHVTENLDISSGDKAERLLKLSWTKVEVMLPLFWFKQVPLK